MDAIWLRFIPLCALSEYPHSGERVRQVDCRWHRSRRPTDVIRVARPRIAVVVPRLLDDLRRRVKRYLHLTVISANEPECVHHLHPERRSEEHTSELQSLMRISYAVFCLKKKKQQI